MKQITLAFCLTFFLLALFSKQSQAQYYFYNDNYYDNPVIIEAGVSLDAMNSLTDLGGKKGIGKKFIKDLNIGNTHFAGGIFVSAIFKNAVAIRLEATFGKLSAQDSVLKGITDIAKARYNRNLSFRTNITEVALMAELHPLYMFIDWVGRDEEPPRMSPYLLAGVGYFSFNPQTRLGNNWVDLQPLSTEGQGFKEYPDKQPYKLHQLNIPFGLGVKYELATLFNVRAEFLYRKLNTDYLDDVSGNYINPAAFQEYFTGAKLNNALILNDRQITSNTNPLGGSKRGSPKQKDAYFTFNLKIGLVIGRNRIE